MRRYLPILSRIGIIIGFLLIFEFSARLFAEILWFKELDYLSVFLLRRFSQYFLWLVVACCSGLYIGGNLWLAKRWQWQWLPKDDWYEVGVPVIPQQKQRSPLSDRLLDRIDNRNSWKWNDKIEAGRSLTKQTFSPRLSLPLLLTAAIAVAVGITCILINYTDVALTVWQTSYRLPQIVTSLKPPLDLFALGNFAEFFIGYLRQLTVIVIVAGLLLWQPKISLRAIAILLSMVFGAIAAGNWALVLRFLNPSNFDLVDPQFGKEIGFFIFRFPLWQLIESWLLGLSWGAFLSCVLFYLLSGNSLSEGRFPGFSKIQLRHISFLGAVVMLSLAVRHWLNRFDLLYSSRGVVYGAGYTNIYVQLPIEVCLSVVSIISAIWLLYKGFAGYRNLQIQQRKIKKIILLIFPFTAYLLVLLVSNLASATVQRLVVQPNELAKEQPYIERSIALTRKAFNLDNIEAQTFNPQGQLSSADIQNNDSTIDNIRLWDTRPILQTNRQLQQIRPYYQFHDADIDSLWLERRFRRRSEKTAGNYFR